MQSDPAKLVEQNTDLNHLTDKKVISHVQRDDGEWVQHSLMLDGYEVPFKFKRREKYRSLKGAQVNLTYYPVTETVAGMPFEIMKVVRVKRA